LIELQNIVVKYPNNENDLEILKSISLKVNKGESVAIVGESGSGKTTLLSVLGGLLKPVSGTYQFENQDVYNSSDETLSTFRGGAIGFVFQEFFLLPHLTVFENIMLPFDHAKTRDKLQEKKRVNKLLEQVGLSEFSSKFPNQLSGGQVQRVAIARALVKKPKLILADEPTGNLDEKMAKSIIDLLLGLVNSETSVVIVTHNLTLASIFSRQIRIVNGVIK